MEFGSVFCKSDLLQIMTIGGIRFSSDLFTDRTERSYVFTARSSDFLSDRLSTNKTNETVRSSQNVKSTDLHLCLLNAYLVEKPSPPDLQCL